MNIKSRLNIRYAKSLNAFVHDTKNKWMWFAFLLLVGFSSLKRRKQNIDWWKESVNKSSTRTSLRSCGLTAPAGAAAAGLSGVWLPGRTDAGPSTRQGPSTSPTVGAQPRPTQPVHRTDHTKRWTAGSTARRRSSQPILIKGSREKAAVKVKCIEWAV